ncbi:hypothetical protein EOM39_07110 [Candidatus Gracilibacteria bacterium]|nr:hypothetical protein [Candidatus Gracilibacteria bacterium]
MEEKEIKDNSEIENEDIDDGLVEVVEEEISDNEDTFKDNNPENQYPSSTNKLTAVIYLVIFVSILIGVYFYVKQNPDLLKQITGNESSQTGETDTNTGEENIIDTNSGIVDDNTNSENIDNSTLINEGTNSNKDPSNTSTSSSGTATEEVIIEDFEKELDSLFDAIDENAK